ncbi:FAD-dependent pyridine nucleotide-disulfide oxidoreductase [Candidatus Methylomirabilis lanthanidiphila]|uniref:FAD-dependent pyridine nucleotide-disulfide oxidoreductase n=1 Tax=Candidatus Methylomirabilis lanthanidiphila TaxID=2211376 RepID=A0A564ZLH3_9BACT|nr:FAD-dependent oxidoreductase [Candidatus Methylomirabilis lanthanidiphila]VUZ86189.1 FAD-dependent pyridine nucleotide-disulfide oxidoreductase [Candidatus Methylomirabilis lanthanidiphila]
MSKQHHVIIGASAAGLAAVEAIRKVDKDCPITVVSKEPLPLYSRVGLTHFIAREVGYDGMRMRDDDYFDRMKVRGLMGVAALSVDPTARRIALSNGENVAYDNLLVTSGSHAVMPPIPGTNLQSIYTCITNVDAKRIDEAIAGANEVAVIGAGLIGIQVVDALIRRGCKTTVIEQMPHVMPAMADAVSAAMMEDELRKAGVTVRCGVRATELLGKDSHITGVKVEGGEVFPCQLLVMAAGVAPNVDFLNGTGVKMNRGLAVDACQRTSLDGIYAAGDVAETVDMFSGERVVNAIWPEALNQGRIAGLNMAGVATPYEGSMAMNVTSVLQTPVASIGAWNPQSGGRYQIREVRDDRRQTCRKLVFDGEQLVGAMLVGTFEDAGILHNMIRTRKTFTLKPDHLAPATVRWGTVLRAIHKAGRV